MDFLLLLLRFSFTLSKWEGPVNMRDAGLLAGLVLEQFVSHGAMTYSRS
jgi:hypothetical protein